VLHGAVQRKAHHQRSAYAGTQPEAQPRTLVHDAMAATTAVASGSKAMMTAAWLALMVRSA